MGTANNQLRNAGASVVRNLLQRLLIELKEDFHRSCDPRGLNLSPQSALIAADTIHDPRNVSKVALEFLLQDLCIPVRETVSIRMALGLRWHLPR